MKKTELLKSNLFRLIISMAAVFLLSTCDNLLQIGMGSEVDLEYPSSTLLTPEPGGFVSGNITFTGSSTDDQTVAKVEISFDKGTTWTDVVLDDDAWSYGYNTTGNTDGKLRVLLRTTDGAAKVTTSEEYLFSVDNTPPVVMVTSPRNFDSSTFNTSVTLTVAATDVFQIVSFRVNAEAATIPVGFDTATGDPDTLTWESLTGFPKTINQSASPLSYEFNSLPFTVDRTPEALHRYFRFTFRAQDEAGNVSSKFFHINDVAAINDNLLLTVDQIADILEGTNYTNTLGTTLTAASLTAVERTVSTGQLLLEFDEDTDLPVAKLSFPTSSSSALPTMRSTDSLQGYFDDDDGIDTATMRLKIEKAVGWDSLTSQAASWETSQDWIQPANFESTSDTRIDWEQPVIDYGQGVFRVTLDTKDVNGTDRTTDYFGIYMVSDGAPTLEINPPANLNFNDAIYLSGTASHAIAITSLTLSIGYGPTSSPVWVFADLPAVYDEGTSVWTFDTDVVDFASLTPAGGLDNLAEGEILVRAVANGETTKNIFLYKDITPPTVSFDTPEAAAQLNTDALIKGSADDSYSGLSSIKVLVSHPDMSAADQDPATSTQWQPYSASAVLGTDGYEFGSSLTSWRYTFDTTDYSDNIITFYIKAVDKAGNETSPVSRNFEIYQDSDLPVISMSNIDVAGSYFDNVLAGEPHLLGSITDDDQVDPDTFRYRVKKLDATWGSWVYPYAPGEKALTTRLDFNIAVYEPGTVSTPLGEGTRDVQLWVEDVNGLGISRTAAESGGALDLAFAVDGNPPTISLTGPVSGSLKNSSFNITGNVGDGFGIDLVQLSFDGGVTYPQTLYSYGGTGTPVTSYTINYPVTVGGTGLADGTYNLRVRAQDLSGSSTSENCSVVIDTTKPVITISQPDASAVVNGAVALSGSIVEVQQMDATYYWVGTFGSTVPAYTVADPTLNGWIKFADSRNLSDSWDSYAEQDPTFAVQDYTIHMVARDLAGNWSTDTTRTVTVNQESDRPVIAFTNIDEAGSGMPSPIGTAPDNLLGSNAAISGTVSDDDGVTYTDMLISTSSYDWDTDSWSSWSSWTAVSVPYTSTRTSWNWSKSVSGLGEGVHQAMIRVLDKDFSTTLPGGATIADLLDTDTVAEHPTWFKWNQTGIVEFAIDLSAPAVGIDVPSKTITSGAYSMTGTASDSSVISQVLVSTDGGTTFSTTGVTIDSGAGTGAVTWSWTGDLSAKPDGAFTLKAKAVDAFAKSSVSDLTVTIDKTAPVITISAPTSLDVVNDQVALSGTIVEVQPMDATYYWVGTFGSTAPVYDIADPTLNGWKKFNDPRNLSAGWDSYAAQNSTYVTEDYTIHMVSRDLAGNWSTDTTRTVTVNQESDRPVIGFTNIDEAGSGMPSPIGTAPDNLLGASAAINGTVSDDDGVPYTDILISTRSYDWAASSWSVDWSTWSAVSVPYTGTRTTWNWTKSVSGLGEGVHQAMIRVLDKDFTDTLFDTDTIADHPDLFNWNQTEVVEFAIDLSAPVVGIDVPSKNITSGAYSMTGTASDSSVISQVLVSTDGGATYSATGVTIDSGAGTGSVTWSWTGDLSAKPEGAFTLKAKAIDAFAKSSVSDLTVTIDKTAPVITISEPVALDVVNGDVALSGTIIEVQPMDATYYWVGTFGSTAPVYDIADPTLNGWTKFVDSRNLSATWESYAAQDPTFVAEDYTIHMVARDSAGNWSLDTTRTVTADQESDRPGIEFTNIDAAGNGMPSPYGTTPTNILGANAALTGTVSDDDGVTYSDMLISTRSYDWDTESWGTWSTWGAVTVSYTGTRASWNWSKSVSGLGEGVHQAMIRVLDKDFSTTLPGGATIADLLDTDTTADHPDWFKWNQSAVVEFAIDLSLPSVSVSSPASGTYVNAPFTITGSASDSNRLLEYDPGSGLTDYILVLEDGGSDWTGAVQTAVDSGTDVWTYGADFAVDGTADGYKTWQYRAEDRMGNITTHEFNFTVDTIPPTVSIASFVPSVPGYADYVNGIVKFSAAAGDDNQIIQQVKYWVLLSTDTAPTASTFAAGGTVLTAPYTGTIDTTDTGTYTDETYYTLYIGAADKAGNKTIISREFYISQVSDYPQITLTNLDDSINIIGSASSNLLESNPKITGTVSDDDWVDSTSLKISIDGAAPVPVTISTTGTEVAFNYSLSSLAEGVHYFQLSVSDTNDGTNNRKLGEAIATTTGPVVYLAIDQSNPVVSIDTPANIYTKGPFTMTGTATDGNVVSQVLVSTDGGTTYSATGVTITSGAGTSSQVWSWTGNLSAKPEGSLTLKVKAIDEFSKPTTADLTIKIDKSGPVMSITSPGTGTTVNGLIDLSGGASDAYGIVSYVEYALDSNGDGNIVVADGDIDWALADGTSPWTLTGLDTTALADITYTLHVRGTDLAGNISAADATRSFIVDQSTDRPTIISSTLNSAGTYASNILSGTQQISGTVSDDDLVDVGTIYFKLTDDSGTVITDWGTVSNPTSFNSNLVNWSHQWTAGNLLSDGKYQLYLRAADTNYNAVYYSGDINYAGDYTDYADIYSFEELGPIEFSYDSANPTGTVDTPTQGKYVSPISTEYWIDGSSVEWITLSGTAYDGNGIQSIQITFNSGDSYKTVTPVDTGDGKNYTWSYEYAVDYDYVNDLAGNGVYTDNDGLVSYTVLITDNYNKPTPVNSYFTVDTNGPVVTYSEPGTADTIANGNVQIRGITSDVSGVVKHVYYALTAIGVDPTDPPADPVSGTWTGWTDVGTYSWSTTVNSTAYATTPILAAGTVDSATTTSLTDDALDGLAIGSGDRLEINGSVVVIDTFDDSTDTVYWIDAITAPEADDSYTVYDYNGLYNIHIRSVDNSGNVSDDSILSIIFDQDRDKPVISFSNLNDTTLDGATDNIFGAGNSIFGIVSDDDGINASSIEISYSSDGGGSWSTWGSVSTRTTSSFSHLLNTTDFPDSPATYQVKFRVTDTQAAPAGTVTTTSAVYEFAVNRSNPNVSINDFELTDRYTADARSISTENGGSLPSVIYLNNSFDMITSISDSNDISLVEVSYNGAGYISNVTNPLDIYDNGDGTWTFSKGIDFSGDYDGNPLISIRVTDNWVGVTVKTITVVTETTEPDVAISQPEEGDTVNGTLVTIKGTVSSSVPLISTSPQIYIGPNHTELTRGGSVNNFTATFDSTSAAIFPGGDGTYNIYVFAEDVAGNVNSEYDVADTAKASPFYDDISAPFALTPVRSFIIDQSTDKPVIVTATLLPAAGASVAGTVIFQSTVTDDDAPSYVNLEFDLDNNGSYETPFASNPINITNGVWSALIDLAGTYGANGSINYQVTPYDNNVPSVQGNSVSRSIYIDATAPEILSLNYSSNTQVNGSINLTGTIRDDALLDTSYIQISFDGGSTYSTLSMDTGPTDLSDGYQTYTFDESIDTTSYFSNDSGILYVVLKVTDNTYKQSSVNLNFNVDNKLPTAIFDEFDTLPYVGANIYTFDGKPGDTDPTNHIIGSAYDTGLVSGIKKVNVYFVKHAPFIDPSDGITVINDDSFISPRSGDILSTAGYEVTVKDSSLADQSIVFPDADLNFDTDLQPTHPYIITIDNRLELGQYDTHETFGDNDGFNEGLKSKSGYDEWQAYFDTTLFPDGPIDLYYVVYDEAGNSTYGVVNGQMNNYPPSITNVTVGVTPLNTPDSVLKVSNTVSNVINAEDASGGGAIDVSEFKLSVIGKYSNNGGSPNLADEDTGFTSFFWGAQTGAVKDFDSKTASDGTPASATIAINTVALYSDTAVDSSTVNSITDTELEGLVINPGWELTIDGSTVAVDTYDSVSGTITWTGSTYGTPPTGAYSVSAFVSGEWYLFQAEVKDSDGNIDTFDYYLWVSNNDISAPDVYFDDDPDSEGWITVSDGHHEPKGITFNTDDPNLSGQIILSGTAYDDTAVDDILIRFFAVDTWSASDWLTADSVTSIVPTGGDTTTGYWYSWSYTWNTDDLPSTYTAAADVLIQVAAVDSSGNTTVTPAQKQVDVVPYITNITGTGFEGGLLSYVKRSAAGRYPISTGSTLTITGYNLPGTAAGGLTVGGTSLTATGATGTTSMTVPLGTTATSGAIIAVTDSVLSDNNTNDNTLSDNKEPNLYNSSLTDDRYAIFWNVDSIPLTGTFTEPTMQMNNTGTFDWMYIKNGKNLYYLPSSGINLAGGTITDKMLTTSNGLSGGDFTYNDDGSLIFLFNHNSQWTAVNDTYGFTGSVQWGMIQNISGYSFVASRDEAYNWNNGLGYGKLGIGNVSFRDTEQPLPYSNYSAYNTLDLNRYKNLKIVTSGGDSATRNYVAYFDTGAEESRSIVFYAFKAGDTAANVAGTLNVYENDAAGATTVGLGSNDTVTAALYANIDKYYETNNADDLVALAGTQSKNNTGIATPRGRQEVTTANQGYDSEDFDLAVYEKDGTNHYAFIAYFDEKSNPQALKIAVNESAYNALPTGNAAALGTWVTDTIDTKAGSDVAMAIDPKGGIHLAYQDVNTGYLKYAYVQYNDSTNTFSAETYFVDALIGAGANNSIVIKDFGQETDDYRPVIVTYSSAYTGTKAALRLSYPFYKPSNVNFGAGADSSSGQFLGNWETIALTANTNPDNAKNFLFIDGSGNAHLGYEAGTLEEASFLGLWD